MPQPTSEEVRKQRQERLVQVLNELTAKGQTQLEIAECLAVPQGYLSDVKNGHRLLSELFARRFSDEFAVNSRWLLHGEGTMAKPLVGPAIPPSLKHTLSEPCLGDPAQSPARTGYGTEVAGHAVPLLAEATLPYVLELPYDAPAMSLRRGDLLLMDQKAKPTSRQIVVLRHSTKGKEAGKLVLARRTPRGAFVRLDDGAAIRGQVEEVGQVLGLVWRAM